MQQVYVYLQPFLLKIGGYKQKSLILKKYPYLTLP